MSGRGKGVKKLGQGEGKKRVETALDRYLKPLTNFHQGLDDIRTPEETVDGKVEVLIEKQMTLKEIYTNFYTSLEEKEVEKAIQLIKYFPGIPYNIESAFLVIFEDYEYDQAKQVIEGFFTYASCYNDCEIVNVMDQVCDCYGDPEADDEDPKHDRIKEIFAILANNVAETHDMWHDVAFWTWLKSYRDNGPDHDSELLNLFFAELDKKEILLTEDMKKNVEVTEDKDGKKIYHWKDRETVEGEDSDEEEDEEEEEEEE